MTRTNAFTLLCIAIRAVIVWVAASALVGMPAVLFALRHGDSAFGGTGVSLAVMGSVLVALALAWVFADKLARLALAGPREQVFESSLEPRVWLGLAISIIGAWFLFLALKDGAYLIVRWIMISRAMPGSLTLDNGLDQLLPDAVATVFEAILATVFLLRGRGLANLVHRWRYGSLQAESTDRI
ncbi:hypothetical protein OVA13_10400 [Pseudoxanthomonas sp. SL93]|uniref:hypothetical protein n=1 Tax=Pseudoxanthomonas sp. SL93 TaxID=2995142 RepID=UPI00226DEF98|nr:hypothetical protein [Pseudoxanthomonas sp. SL93]WAC61824.1 hypothetical protein OVA13_10400 [Pseudoxanthomonas sp. SL93]